jgi:hypothetical protein
VTIGEERVSVHEAGDWSSQRHILLSNHKLIYSNSYRTGKYNITVKFSTIHLDTMPSAQ